MGSRALPRPGATGADRWFGIKSQIHSKLLNSLTPDQLKTLNKEGVREQIGNVVERLIADEQIPMTVAERERLIEEVLDEVFGLGPLEELLKNETLTTGMLDFLSGCVEARLNMVVSGGSGAGKTTLLNTLSRFIPEEERVVTIEDTAELQMQQSHVVRLETRPINIEGAGAITQRDLVINTLRMRPDRIIVGESRGAEALDMLQAMNTGHDGSMTTTHANSPRDAFSRLETMVMMASQHIPDKVIRQMLTSAIQIVVHTSRMIDGTRKVPAISEVGGVEGEQALMHDVFTFERTGISQRGRVLGKFAATGYKPLTLGRL